MKNFYQILGINQNASIAVIKKAYRNLALSEHPDKGGDAEKMSFLTQAYQTLSDPIKRREFDKEWEIYNICEEEDFSILLSGYLPTAGVAFSAIYRKEHAELVDQFKKKPLNQGSPSNYFKSFHSNLYSSEEKAGVYYHDVFSFIKNEHCPEIQLNIKFLTPEKAIELFLKFLQGDYRGNTLNELSAAFTRKIKDMEINPSYYSQELVLFNGIHEILTIAINGDSPDHTLLDALKKITDYAALTAEQSMVYFALLFQSKYFRNLFSQGLHLHWQSDEIALDADRLEMFDGQLAAKKLIERLKKKLSENSEAGQSNKQVAKLLQYVRLLSKLEKDLHKDPYVSYQGRATFYRNKAFHLLDWMPALIGISEQIIIVNTLMQVAIHFQKASIQETNIALKMADEKIARQLYLLVMQISRHATPDVELYVQAQGFKFLLACQYIDSELEELIGAFQHRCLFVADMFPFFQSLQCNIEFVSQEDRTIVLMRQLLHALIDRADKAKAEGSETTIDHTYVRVFYQAYEACLKHWYQKNHQPELEKAFRSRLMDELLLGNKWEHSDLDYNLNAPWAMKELLNEEGWSQFHQTIALAKKANVPTYSTVHGLEINYTTGKMAFILDSCKADEPDFNRLLTLYDLDEMFQNQMTSAYFSLDSVDPDMPYHPFNQMRFAPSTLYHSQLLHTMLLTDYLLKFLTVGQEVQCQHPYDLRSLDEVTKKLPLYLKKIIDNFHEDNHQEAVHRFWIESEAVPYAIDDEELNTTGNVLFAFDEMKMIVKHQRMVRDVDGNLIDKEGEGEGWACYVLTSEQLQELEKGNRRISDPAMIIIKKTSEVIFWENKKAEQHCVFPAAEQHHLIRLSKRKRDAQERVLIDDAQSLRLIYRVTRKAAAQAGISHRFSPEFIFAQEFTAHYNELAIYFPELGRLRELSKATVLVNIMANQREMNKKNLANYRDYLKDKTLWSEKEHRYWQETEQEIRVLIKDNISKNFELWLEQFSKENLRQKQQKIINDFRKQIAPLKFTEESQKVKDLCQELHGQLKGQFFLKFGFIKWNESVSQKIWKESIDPKIPEIITELTKKKYGACLEQLKNLFKNQLSHLSDSTKKQLLDKFLNGDDKALLEELMEYRHKEVIKEIKDIFPEHTLESLNRIFTSPSYTSDEVVETETKKALEKHKDLLNEKINSGIKLENSFTELKFGATKADVNLDGSCLWVPASIQHDVDASHRRVIYGGVQILGIARHINPAHMKILANQTRQAGQRLWQNKVWGDAANHYHATLVRQQFSDPKYDVRVDNPTFSTAHGRRRWDVNVLEENRLVHASEVKTGNSLYNARQQRIDDWKRSQGCPVDLVRYPGCPVNLSEYTNCRVQ